MRYLPHILLASLLLTSCHEEPTPQTMVGLVAQANEQTLTINNDTTSVRRFAIDEQTILEGGALVEGNLVEVIYMPTEDGSLPTARLITADATYAEALGRWSDEQSGQLRVDFTLLPHGRISQQQPEGILHFTRWELSDEQGIITLHGTLSLPPDWVEYNRLYKIDKQTPLPTRRVRQFSVRAAIGRQSDSNTEIRHTLTIQSGHDRATLYLQQ